MDLSLNFFVRLYTFIEMGFGPIVDVLNKNLWEVFLSAFPPGILTKYEFILIENALGGVLSPILEQYTVLEFVLGPGVGFILVWRIASWIIDILP